MTKYLFIFLIFTCRCASAQQMNTQGNYIKVIEDYYSDFQTGYSFDGIYVNLSNNYKATFSGPFFTLTFDHFDENKNIQHQQIKINLKDVVSLEPYDTELVEIHSNEPLILPICGRLALTTEKQVFKISIHYQVEGDIMKTEIYKAFEAVWKYHQRSK